MLHSVFYCVSKLPCEHELPLRERERHCVSTAPCASLLLRQTTGARLAAEQRVHVLHEGAPRAHLARGKGSGEGWGELGLGKGYPQS